MTEPLRKVTEFVGAVDAAGGFRRYYFCTVDGAEVDAKFTAPPEALPEPNKWGQPGRFRITVEFWPEET